MPATDPQILLSEVACFCNEPVPIADQLRLALEIRALLAVDPAADVTPQGLADLAACFQCQDGVSPFQATELAVLDLLSQALAP